MDKLEMIKEGGMCFISSDIKFGQEGMRIRLRFVSVVDMGCGYRRREYKCARIVTVSPHKDACGRGRRARGFGQDQKGAVQWVVCNLWRIGRLESTTL